MLDDGSEHRLGHAEPTESRETPFDRGASSLLCALREQRRAATANVVFADRAALVAVVKERRLARRASFPVRNIERILV
jgi:hypothetical protein